MSSKELKEQANELSDEIKDHILNYMRSEGPGGKQVIGAFLEEFEELSNRSPRDDPTNLRNHLPFLVKHMKQTWDDSLTMTEDGEIQIGLCTDETLGFTEDVSKLRHKPVPTVWVVFLIRGIAGRYAFVNPSMYQQKKNEPMPGQYFGGFLISKKSWDREGWGVLGSFDKYEHPASGASSIPFGKNAMRRVNMEDLIHEAILDYKSQRGE
jgi:hypothetical protein